MKSLFIILLLCIAARFTAAAQNLPTFKKLSSGIDTSGKNDRLQGARLAYTTPQGSVYTLSPDRSACLVPDMKKVIPMPTVRTRTPERMPNAYKKTKER
jgi:hypothetical protein